MVNTTEGGKPYGLKPGPKSADRHQAQMPGVDLRKEDLRTPEERQAAAEEFAQQLSENAKGLGPKANGNLRHR